MNSIEENIINWENKFNTYLELENKCNLLINNILEIKNNLKKLIGNQKKEDIVFYKSLVDNSHFYLLNSLKIRKLKFQKDLNYIMFSLDTTKKIDDLSKASFLLILKEYRKIGDDINQAKKNSTSLTWVKDDKIESLMETENDMNEIMDYHLNLIKFFYSSVELEKIFYCGK